MENVLTVIAGLCIQFAGKIVGAIIAYIVGKWIINKLLTLLEKTGVFSKGDATLAKYLRSFVKGLLYVILVISIIGILGVPMASVITVLASAGVAVGMSLQGSLSNLAGGIMLMIFKPFKAGDYVITAGAEGFVKDITLFYTILTTIDNKTVTIPNGSLMNANVTNCSSEELRRVDLVFACAKGEEVKKVQDLMVEVMNEDANVLKDPAPFARISGGTNESMEFTVRAWCKSADYWTVYFDLNQHIVEKLGEAGIKAPAARVLVEGK